MDIPSEKFLVRNVKTKSEFQVYVSDLKSDIMTMVLFVQ